MFLKTIKLLPILFLYASNLAAQDIDSLMAEQMLQRAQTYQAGSQFELALSSADSSVAVFSEIFGRRHLKTAEALEVILKLKNLLGEYAPALELAKEVLDIRESLLPPDHAQIAYAMNNIGILSDGLGDSRTGLRYKLNALAILENENREINEDILKSYLNIGASYMDLSENDSALYFLDKGLRMTVEHFDSNENIFTGYYFSNLGIVYEHMGLYEEARRMKEQALTIRLKLHGEIHPDVGAAYANLASSFQLAGDNHKALELSKKALKIFQEIYGDRHPVIGQLYNNLSAFYSAVQDYATAADCVRRALDIYNMTIGEMHPYVAQSYNNLAAIMGDLGEHEQSLLFYKKSIGIYEQTLGSEDPTTASTVANMGVPLERLKRYEEAVENYRHAIGILKKSYNPQHFYLSFPYTGLGNVFASQKRYQESLAAFDTALWIKQQAFGLQHPETAISQINVSNVNTYLKYFEPALDGFQKVIAMTDTLETLLPRAQYHFLRSRAFEGMGVAFRFQYEAEGKSELLQKSSAFLNTALEEITAQKLLEYAPESEKAMGPALVQIAENGINVARELAKTQPDVSIQALRYSEHVKAFHLLESLQESKAAKFAGVPEELTEQEKQLKIAINFYEKCIFENAGKDSLLIIWRKKLIEKKDSLETLIALMKSGYPEYFNLKYNLATLSVPEIQQKLLRSGEALLEYFVGDSLIYIFVVTPDDYRMEEVKRDFPLQIWVDSLRNNIYKNRSTGSAFYVQAAVDLYDKLVRPVEKMLPERLIIIPDGLLSYIPFEALLTERPENPKHYHTHAYLLRKYQISYCYSATLLGKMRERQHRQPPAKDFAGFAPYYTGSLTDLKIHRPMQFAGDTLLASLRSTMPDLGELRHSGTEVRSIQALTGGDVFFGEAATESHFLKIAGEYRVLHLATHGLADSRAGDYSFLAFYWTNDSIENELLHVRDLYNLQLNADLVVLSACETGLGELQKGEGVISLARAFAYAGAKCIVNTLWKVDDARTKDLMITFYDFLKKGKTKDEALRLAKLAYIENNEFQAQPFFWAGLIGVGDMSAVW